MWDTTQFSMDEAPKVLLLEYRHDQHLSLFNSLRCHVLRQPRFKILTKEKRFIAILRHLTSSSSTQIIHQQRHFILVFNYHIVFNHLHFVIWSNNYHFHRPYKLWAIGNISASTYKQWAIIVGYIYISQFFMSSYQQLWQYISS